MTTMAGPRQLLFGDRAATLALEVLKECIDKLPLKDEDKQDLWGFVGDWLRADDEEDRAYIEKAMQEVVLGPKGTVARLAIEATEEAPEGYTKWVTWVSSQVKKQRTSAGLTQQQLAKKSGLPQSHISRIENAVHSPSHATLSKIADALGLPLSAFDPSASDDSFDDN